MWVIALRSTTYAARNAFVCLVPDLESPTDGSRCPILRCTCSSSARRGMLTRKTDS